LPMYLTKYHAIKTYVGSEAMAPHSFNLGTRLRLSGQLHAPVALPRKDLQVLI